MNVRLSDCETFGVESARGTAEGSEGEVRRGASRVLVSVLLAFCFGLLSAGAPAQLATLVEDFAPGTGFGGAFYGGFHSVGERAVFTVARGDAAVIYSTSGHPSETTELPVRGEFRFRLRQALLYAEGSELWRTDGTRDGSWRLAAPGLANYDVGALQSVAELDDGTVLVLSLEGVVVSNGQPNSGRMADINLPSPAQFLLPAGRWAFALTSGGEVVLTDGQSSEVLFSTPKRLSDFRVSGERLFFTVEQQDDYELWVADPVGRRATRIATLERVNFGTPRIAAATSQGVVVTSGAGQVEQFFSTNGDSLVQISALPDGSGSEALISFEGGYLFTGLDSDGFRYLWRSDQTADSQMRVAELCRFCSSPEFLPLGDRVLLNFEFSSLYSSDGTTGGTVLLAEGAEDLTVTGARAQYVSGFALNETDGTRSGTRRIAAGDGLLIRGANSFRGPYVASLPRGAVFTAENRSEDTAVWSTEGSPESVRRIVEDLPRGDSSNFRELMAGDGVAFFVPDVGSDVWVADRDGTRSIFPAFDLGCGSFLRLIDVSAGKLLLECNNFGDPVLWVVDAQARRERLTAAASAAGAERPVRLGSEWMFSRGERLFRSDGTNAGTRAFFTSQSSFPVNIGSTGSHGYFFLGDSQGRSFYRTDLTASGTELLGSIDVIRVDAAAVTETGVVYVTGDQELWRIDAVGGAVLLQGPRPASSETMLPFGDGVIYAGVTSQGLSAIATDGTDFVRLGPLADSFAGPVVVGDRVFFFAPLTSSQVERIHVLWSSDGKSLGESLGASFDTRTSFSQELVALGDTAFFIADDPDLGREIWTSDGTPDGTRLAHDLWPGRSSSYPRQLSPAGDILYFLADDGLVGSELFKIDLQQSPCSDGGETACLNRSRFRVETTWMDFQGNAGRGRAEAITDDTAYFWFFDPANVEVVLKVLDGTPINGAFWVFSGALSDVFYAVTVTDSETGQSRRYLNPRGNFGSFGDTNALRDGSTSGVIEIAAAADAQVTETSVEAAACSPGPQTVCLNGDRFQVEVDWKTTQGTSGQGNAVQLTEDTGYFWFFDADNVELVLKVLDATGVNGKYWVFYGSLSDVEYEMRVTDTLTGQVKTYRNENGTFASVGDTEAF